MKIIDAHAHVVQCIAGTAGVITLALGKAYIEVCKAIKMGKLNQDDLTKKAGLKR